MRKEFKKEREATLVRRKAVRLKKEVEVENENVSSNISHKNFFLLSSPFVFLMLTHFHPLFCL